MPPDEEREVPGLRGASAQSDNLNTEFLLTIDDVDGCLHGSAAQEQVVLYCCVVKARSALVPQHSGLTPAS